MKIETINIGPKSTQCLNEIGIYTVSQLEEVGAIQAYSKMMNECKTLKPSLNLLYGLVAILEGIHWREVAKYQKGRLLMELEEHKEFENMLTNIKKSSDS